MRPAAPTPVHRSGLLAELVCSNSFKSTQLTAGAGLLKAELRVLGSMLLQVAEDVRIPAGTSLTVDREEFSSRVTQKLESCPGLTLVREEIREIPGWPLCVIATGPLTSGSLSGSLAEFVGKDNLFFYDAIAPIVDAESIDPAVVYAASRYGKGDAGYLNCPFTEDQYRAFWEALVHSQVVELREVDRGYFFEGCLPLEELAARGYETMAFGPLKPVGLELPTGEGRPFAVLQLRPENRECTMYGLVGCQTRMTRPEQRRVFRMVPGLESAGFLRYGSVHRNTYMDAPKVLNRGLMAVKKPGLFFAGQLVGGEGYTEAVGTGLLAGFNAWRYASGREQVVPPEETALGGLVRYICEDRSRRFAPMNFNFGLLPRVKVKGGHRRREAHVARALDALKRWKRTDWDEA
jgi:methylenetetrahydrofolate--tRNA-(uracil-5-)-methyltransferase